MDFSETIAACDLKVGSQIKFDHLGFSIGKSENSRFSETIAASDLKVSRSRHQLNV